MSKLRQGAPGNGRRDGKIRIGQRVLGPLKCDVNPLKSNFSFKQPLKLKIQDQLPSGPKIPVSSFVRTQDAGCPALPVCARWYST